MPHEGQEEFHPGISVGLGLTGPFVSTSISGGSPMGWMETGLALLGDVLDPFLPGGAGSELRPTSSTVTIAKINESRRSAGLPPLRTRHRRRRALSKSDKEDIAFVAGMLGKPAGRDFAMIVAGTR